MQIAQKTRVQNKSRSVVAGLIAAIAFTCAITLTCLATPSTFAADKLDNSSSAKVNSYALVPAKSRALAPNFNLSDIDGKSLRLSDYRGHVVLLDFWAVDCGGCIREIPWYVEFDQKYRSRGLSLIGLDMYGEKPDRIRPFMAKTNMEYRVAIGNDSIRKEFHAEELPMTLLIDKQGRVALSHIGIVDKAMFERNIQGLLK